MNFIFEKLALNDLMDMLSLKFENPKRAIKYVTSHLFAIKINSHTAVSLAFYQDNKLILDEVGVLPNFRHKGLGYAIAHHALEDGSKKGLTSALLGATDAGGTIYQRLGFKEGGSYKVYNFPYHH